MNSRSALLDLTTRKLVCNACLSTFRKRSTATATAWLIRQSSQAVQATGALAPVRTKRRSPEQDSERLKALEALGLLKDTSDKFTVNFFDQGENGSIRHIQNEHEFGEILTDPGGELDARLREFEDQLKGVTTLVKAIEQLGGKQEADKLRRQLAADTDSNTDGLLGESNNESAASSAIPISGLQGHPQDRINRLNNWIQRCMFREKNRMLPKDIKGFWKAYSAARTTLSGRWHTVPSHAWDVLWRVLAAEYPFDTSRMTHIFALAKDMQQAGIPLKPEQQVLAIEAMFVDGWEKEAIDNHRRHVSTLGANPETFVSFWQLGLHMYCRIRDVERAQRVASTILESTYEIDPRFVLPLIKLCAETPTAAETGFKIYRNLRDSLGTSINSDDYDLIISYFLATGNTEFALFIFVDMMKSGSIDLMGVQDYPPTVRNPFFFGKWLKRLIGTGNLDGAFEVLRFMRSRAITPRVIQVNGLLGAWLRSGVADDAQKAEDVAWAMIHHRIQFVEMRRRKLGISAMRLYTAGDGWPIANLETFSLLAESYQERGLTTKMASLWESFQGVEIAPDSFIMNKLLISLIQEGKYETVLPASEEMAQTFNLTPDPHTFMVLWQALPANRLTRIPFNDLADEASRTRALFAKMMKHVSVFRSKENIEIDIFLARTILHSFRKIQDGAGLLLAYRALRRVLRYNPPDMVIFEMLLGTQDLERIAKRREGVKLIRVRANLDRYLEHRRRELVDAAEIEDGENLSPEIRVEEAGNFLEHQLEADFAAVKEADAQRLAQEAAQEMGLQGSVSQEVENSQHDI